MKLSDIRKKYKSYINTNKGGIYLEKRDAWEKIPILYPDGHIKEVSTWRYLMFGG